MNSTKTFRGMAAVLAAFGLVQAAPALADVVGSDGWTRATVPGASTGVGYLVLTNKGSEDAKLLRIVSPVSDKVMIHRTSVDAQGVARMWPVAKLEIAPGDAVRFAPDGLHVMFSDLKAPFVVGQKVPLELTFEGEPAITVMLEVKPLVPSAGMDSMAMPRHPK